MIKPTIHINGTSAQNLLDGYCDAAAAVRAALEKVAENGPNARDYYVQLPGAYSEAQREHEKRLADLRRIAVELSEIAEHVAESL